MLNGLNAINDNLILLNINNNKNLCGIIAGVEHSGKSFQNKKEVFNALISTNDDISVITDSDEYDEFAKKLGGQIVTEMDIDIMKAVRGYGFQDRDVNEEKDLLLKSYFLDAFFMSVAIGQESRRFRETVEREVSKVTQHLDEMEIDLSGDDNHLVFLRMYLENNMDEYPITSKLIKNAKSSYMNGTRTKTDGADKINSDIEGINTSARLTIYKVKNCTDMLVVADYLRNKAVLDLMGGADSY